jgi:hypothetical protein
MAGIDNDVRSQGGMSRGSNLSSKFSQSLRNTLEKSAGKQGSAAATKVQEMLRKQQEKATADASKSRGRVSDIGSDAGMRNTSITATTTAPNQNALINHAKVGPFSPAPEKSKAL